VIKIGISYNIFDGEEMLPFAVRNLRPYAHYIVVVYQTKSNYGNDNPKLLPLLKKLKEEGLVDELYLYEPELVYEKDDVLSWKSGTLNEIKKRQIGLDICRDNGCDTYMTLDCDELYDPKQFEWAMKDFKQQGYDTSFTQLLTYYKYPNMELRPLETWYQPLFYKIKKDTKFEMQDNYPLHVDRTKMVKAGHIGVYSRDEIQQYHYAYVRHNLNSKVKNSSAQSDEKSAKQILEHFDNWKSVKDGALLIGNQKFELEEVDNKFNIKI
jgi:hypothetical protein